MTENKTSTPPETAERKQERQDALADIAEMYSQAADITAAAELLKRDAENARGDTAATILQTTAIQLLTEAEYWEEAAELRSSIESMEAVRPYLSQNKGSENAIYALDVSITRTKKQLRKLLTHLKEQGKPQRV